MMGSGSFECAKDTEFEELIDGRREGGKINAMGNNCSGPPEFEPTNEKLVTH
jgi:hypothetical protein